MVEAATPLRRPPVRMQPSPGTSLPSPGQRRLLTRSTSSVAFDAVIHNAGIGYREGRVETEPGVRRVFAVNVLAPYILTALIERPDRLVYVSSGMHRSIPPRMNDLLWTKRAWSGSSAYAESKLCDVLLAFAVAQRWKNVRSNALEPGWVATKMGGSSAPDDPHQRLCNAGVARHEPRPIGAINRGLFLSSAPSCAEPDGKRRRDSRGAARRIPPHLRYSS
jgi:NAD(P)-dependent dehydrogenase (short-subunit alcohol dehydrogenase family)